MEDKLIEEFLRLGSKNRRDAVMAYQVYMELCEVKRYWDVEYFFDEAIGTIYFTCKVSKFSPATIFVPIAANVSLSFNDMQRYLTLNKTDQKSVVLVILHPDSTSVYYELTDGMKAPNSESRKSSLDDKRRKLDGDLRKHIKLLKDAAMCQTSVTLPIDKGKNDGPHTSTQ